MHAEGRILETKTRQENFAGREGRREEGGILRDTHTHHACTMHICLSISLALSPARQQWLWRQAPCQAGSHLSLNACHGSAALYNGICHLISSPLDVCVCHNAWPPCGLLPTGCPKLCVISHRKHLLSPPPTYLLLYM